MPSDLTHLPDASLSAAWAEANARLESPALTDDERDELLGVLDAVEGETGRRELAKPLEQRWLTK